MDPMRFAFLRIFSQASSVLLPQERMGFVLCGNWQTSPLLPSKF